MIHSGWASDVSFVTFIVTTSGIVTRKTRIDILLKDAGRLKMHTLGVPKPEANDELLIIVNEPNKLPEYPNIENNLKLITNV